MSGLPSTRPEELARIARKLGFELERQQGSHAIYWRSSDHRMAVIPIHRKALKLGTLRRLIKNLGLSIEEFLKLR